MGRRKRRFVKPVYEITLESQNKVYIREEDRGPLATFLRGFYKFTLIPIATLIVATLFFQILQNMFSPPELLISVQHITTGTSLSPAELSRINVYLDEGRKPLPKKVRPDGISVKFRKKGAHIIGVENPASPVDSVLFHREKAFIKNIHLAKSLRKKTLRSEKLDFAFHKIVSGREFVSSKILFYKATRPESPKPHLVFSAFASTPQLLLFTPFAGSGFEDKTPVREFSGQTIKKLADFTKSVGVLTAARLHSLQNQYEYEAPDFDALSWYSDRLNGQRYAFADAVARSTRCTVFLLPALSRDKKNAAVADFVLAFAPLGGVSFQPIQVRSCIADPRSDLFLHINKDVSLLTIIEKYLFIYQDVIETGMVHDSAIKEFAEFCSGLAPQVDALIFYDSQVVRGVTGKPAAAEINLEAFLGEIEPLTCMALYKRLLKFWQDDAAALDGTELNVRNREILRAILRRSLALKAEKHRCSEKNWPSQAQQLALFRTIQKVIGERWTWEWLTQEPWLDMVTSEIDSLTSR